MTKHTGGCHCGAVRYEVTGDLSSAIACNCSHCQIKGLVLSFVPLSDFILTAGEDKLTDYRFNKHLIRHPFCSICGVQPFGFAPSPEGVEMAAINLRTIDGNFFDQVVAAPFNGRDV